MQYLQLERNEKFEMVLEGRKMMGREERNIKEAEKRSNSK